MSHFGVRIVADWLRDGTDGVVANLAALPVDSAAGDVAVTSVTVYDELSTKWLARLMAPHPDAAGQQLVTPAVLVVLQDETPAAGITTPSPQGNVAEGEVAIAVLCLIRDADSAQAATDLMYLLRATRNALLNLEAPAHQAARTRCGVRLDPSRAVHLARIADTADDTLVGAAILITYPTLETTTVG